MGCWLLTVLTIVGSRPGRAQGTVSGEVNLATTNHCIMLRGKTNFMHYSFTACSRGEASLGVELRLAAPFTDSDLFYSFDPTQRVTSLGWVAPSGFTVYPATIYLAAADNQGLLGPGMVEMVFTICSLPPPEGGSVFCLGTHHAIGFDVLAESAALVLDPIPLQTVNEGSALTLPITARATEVPPELVRFNLLSPPAGASINPTNGVFQWTPDESQGPSTNVIQVRVSVNGLSTVSDTNSFTVIVNEVNSAPQFPAIADQVIETGHAWAFGTGATDSDLPANRLTYTLLSGPSGLSLDPDSGVLFWTPLDTQSPSTNLINVMVTDDGVPSLSATQSFTVYVVNSDQKPQLAGIADRTMDELTTLVITNQLSTGGLPLGTVVFDLVSAPPGVVLDVGTGLLTWTPSEAQGPGVYQITVRASYATLPSHSCVQSFVVSVQEVNSAPVWLPLPDQTVLAGETSKILPRGLLREVYEGLAGRLVADLTNHLSYPANPVSMSLVTNLGGVGPGQGQRIRGYLVPSSNGVYSFGCCCAGSYESYVFLSTDQHPENQRLVWASQGSGTSDRQLEAGKLYYLEILSTAPDFIFGSSLPADCLFAPPAIDADLPENLLTYELLSGPDGASVEPDTGQLVWTPSPAQVPSTNVITVKVSDDGTPSLSATQSCTVIVLQNHPPSVTLVAPTNGTVFALGQTIRLEASAGDMDGNLQAVEFLDGTNRLAEMTAPPFCFFWTNASSGSHVVSARAQDRAGATAGSDLVTVRVAEPPRLSDSQFGSDGQFRLLLTGEAGIDYLIEASTNLLDWVPLATNTVGALGTWEFANLEATNYAQRFYRAREQWSGPTTVVWVDDALPAGAITAGNESWNWVSSNPAPFSGSLASQSGLGPGEHNHYFHSATETLTVNPGDVLFAYIYLDPDNLPSEVMLQWNDGSFEHRAYWGANDIAWGTDGTASRRSMGPLPAAGQWVCLQVPACQVDLEGSVLNGLGFTLYDGRATWDYAGKWSP
jgi:hypothetical protein